MKFTDKPDKNDDAAFLRPQCTWFPKGGWVERGRRYAVEESLVWPTRYSLL